MLAALPLVVFTLTFLHFASTDDWRPSYLRAAVVVGLLVVANTEILSLVRLLSLPAVAVTWGFECLMAALATWRRRAALVERVRTLRRIPLPLATLFALVPVMLILAAVGLTAWVAPPNTYDSMTYHMSRVAHWIADRTIDFYPTNIVRQLDQPPLAEYTILQLQILAGDDQFANLVQWFSMAGCVVGASLIAQQLGSQVRGHILAAIVV